jgi:hypothetical protein
MEGEKGERTKTKTNDSRRQAVFVWYFENLNFEFVSDFEFHVTRFWIYYSLILAAFGTGEFQLFGDWLKISTNSRNGQF